MGSAPTRLLTDADRETWKCTKCGHITVTEPGEQILAEFLCEQGYSRRGLPACAGLVKQVSGWGGSPPRSTASGGADGG